MPCRCIRRTLILAAFAALLSPVRASVWYVDEDAPGPVRDGTSWVTAFPSVQPALDAAKSGGEVWVAAGTYLEHIHLYTGTALYGGFLGNETLREQRNPKANVTLLDGGNTGPVVSISEDAERVTVDGFSIRSQQTFHFNGGPRSSVVSAGREVVLSHNLFEENTISYGEDNPTAGGAAIHAYSGSIAIRNNVFRRNSVSVWQGMTFPQFGNLAGAYGGAVLLTSAAVDVSDNVFLGNSVSVGGAISQYEPMGGALYGENITGRITGNTFTGSSTTSGYSVRWRGFGGTLFLANSTVTVANNIVAYNASGIAVLNGSVTLRNNLVFGNPEGDYAGIADPTGTNGNLRDDPLFASLVVGDVHIQPNSPARNAGDTSLATPGGTDLDGQPRVQDGTVDIGADESDSTVYTLGIVVRVRPDGNDANDGSTWALAKKTVQAGIDAAAVKGGSVWVAAGTYLENVRLVSDVALVGGFAGTETREEERNPEANVSVLDGGRKGSVVTIAPNVRATTRIEGFIIRNGTGTKAGLAGGQSYYYGGGIYGEPAPNQGSNYGAAVIRGNIIEGNEARGLEPNVNYPGQGGGIYYLGYPTITDNVLRNNTSGAGGGAFLSGLPVVERNTFKNNTATWGGGLHAWSRATVRNNVFAGNTSVNQGGGAYLDASGTTLVNNTFAGNTAPDGGAVHVVGNYTAPAFTLVNNIVAFNSSGVALSQPAGDATNIVIRRNNYFGNTGADLVNLAAGIGDITTDPLFIDRAGGDFHLRHTSPCIEHGDSAYVRPGETDRDGKPRIAGTAVDIGAYEFSAPPTPPGVADAARAMRIAGGLTPPISTDSRLDADGSGVVDLGDAVLLMREAVRGNDE